MLFGPKAAKFCGSYAIESDVVCLVAPLTRQPIYAKTEDGKALRESPPTLRFMQVFFQALEANKKIIATHVASLAATLHHRHGGSSIAIVSLMRAGTPIGVLLKRALDQLGSGCTHYSISYLGDHGLDARALDYIRARYEDRRICLVDGWTAQGRMVRQIQKAISEYNAAREARLDPGLTVLCDLSGQSSLAATADETLIPSAALNGLGSGLLSPTFYRGNGRFHGCVFYKKWRQFDVTNFFVEEMWQAIKVELDRGPAVCTWGAQKKAALTEALEDFFKRAPDLFGHEDRHRYKIGANETMRALLRHATELKSPGKRRSHRVIVREQEAVLPLVALARDLNVPVEVMPELPYSILTIRY